MIELTVLSAAFVMGAAIPSEYCCTAISPPLSWSNIPPATKSLAVLCDDPDAPAGDWVHWLIFNLPPDTRQLDKGVPRKAQLPNGAIQGTTDYGRFGYDGPCPPPGQKHRYAFKVYALDIMLNLNSSAEKADFLKAAEGHILAEGQLSGTYRR